MNDLRRPVPGTDLRVHPWGLGGNVFGFNVHEATGFEILDAFVDAGGNLVDTADSYCGGWTGSAGGESETLIGNWIRARHARDRIVISTKVGQLPGRDNLRASTIIARRRTRCAGWAPTTSTCSTRTRTTATRPTRRSRPSPLSSTPARSATPLHPTTAQTGFAKRWMPPQTAHGTSRCSRATT